MLRTVYEQYVGVGAILKIKQGELAPVTLILAERGSPVDITSYTEPKLYLNQINHWQGEYFNHLDPNSANLDTGRRVLEVEGEALTKGTAAKGQLIWSPAAADVDTAGYYLLEVTVLDENGKLRKYPTDTYGLPVRIYPSASSGA